MSSWHGDLFTMEKNFEPHNDDIIVECADKWLGFGKRSKILQKSFFLNKFLRNPLFVCLVIFRLFKRKDEYDFKELFNSVN